MKKVNVETVLLQRIVIFLIVILSFAYYRYTWELNKNEQLNNLLRIAGSIESSLPRDDIKALEVQPNDIYKHQYQSIKEKLKAIIRVNSDARFAYLLVERNNKVYFLADSESEDSKDYSPPGQECANADSGLLHFFKDGKVLVTETYTDKWGKWKSVVIPVKDGVTGKNIAVFGMDFNANAWNRRLYYEMAESSVLILLMLLMIIFLFKIQSKNKLLKCDIIERRKAEEVLQFRNVLLATQQEALIEGILVADSDNKILSYNHRFIEMWGIPKTLIENGKNEPVLEYARNKVADLRALSRQVQYLYEHRDLKSRDEIILKNGSVFDQYSAPVVGPDNQYYGRIWSFHDITKHKKDDRMLRLQSNAMEAAIDGLAILDARLNFIYSNNSHARIHGYENSGELVNASLRLLYEPDEMRRFDLEILPELHQIGHYKGRIIGKKKDGTSFHQTISLTLLDNGGLICFVRDITDRVKEENELIEAREKAEEFLHETQKQKSEIELQNERLESLLRISQYKPESQQDLLDYALKEAINLTSSKIGYIYFYNEAKRLITLNTWSPEVMKECSVLDPQTVYELDKTGCWGEAVRQRKPIIINDYKNENPYKKGIPPGHVQLFKFLTIPILIDNVIVALVGVANKKEDYQQSDIRQLTLLMDAVWRISERENMIENLKIAKEHAEESDRLKSAFLANMSHEIRTPMNGILGFAGLLKEPRLSGEEQREYISIIEKSGTRMLNIINDIMSISKVESGQMEVSVKETNINEQIEYIYTFFKPEAEQKGIQLSVKKSLLGKEAIIKTDKEKVYAILTNLVKNAIKFTNTGTIEFGYNLVAETLPHATFLQFYVKDTGIGISKEKKNIIFERFRQANESLNRNYEGAGLGLAISKAYVEMLGGKIRVEDNEEGGSVFYFILPYNGDLEENILVEHEVSETKTVCPVTPLKILIAEDDESSKLLIKKAVSKFASEIFNVRTGNEAVEICRNNADIDLVLMDIRMPGMDGYEATKQIREFNTDVIIIAQTAFALYGDREKAIDAGCNDYIPKPINRSALISLLNKHFEEKGKEVMVL